MLWLCGTKQRLSKIDFDYIDLFDISFSKNVKDLRVVFDCNMTMSLQITKLCQFANYHLRSVKAGIY